MQYYYYCATIPLSFSLVERTWLRVEGGCAKCPQGGSLLCPVHAPILVGTISMHFCSIWMRVLSTQKYCPRGNVNHVANVMTTTVIFRICPILRVRRPRLTVPRVQYCSATAHVVVTKSPLYWRRYAFRCKKYSYVVNKGDR